MEIKEDGTRSYNMNYDPYKVEMEERMKKIWYGKGMKANWWIKEHLRITITS